MFESHYSLSQDFDVSTPELDALVAYARELVGPGGVFGARVSVLFLPAVVLAVVTR